MDRTRSLTEEALAEAELSWRPLTRRPARRRLDADADGPLVRHPDVRRAAARGVNVDEVVALGAAIQAAMEEGTDGRATRRSQFTLAGARRVQDVMSHSLGDGRRQRGRARPMSTTS